MAPNLKLSIPSFRGFSLFPGLLQFNLIPTLILSIPSFRGFSLFRKDRDKYVNYWRSELSIPSFRGFSLFLRVLGVFLCFAKFIAKIVVALLTFNPQF